ncbi:CAZyme family GH28 [Aspergillus niger]|nr:CAZyme family GH28 [Aspergillus niger]KAI2913410.1 CAZyme family GH28 [Aspergillus niger]KAI2942581.1 CAZyme family GH28 [Aspergillus niger]KAI2980553.1 CAZyme family GH28 [Aspergillus niger]KAI2980834.1 CAZyme family GH28 [Aspergillus niger]
MTWSTSFLVATSLLSITNSVHAQLTGSVGPLTSVSDKAAVKTCNVLDYGATSDNTTDVGQPIIDAFADCGSGGLIYIPEGDYLLKNWVSLENGSAWAIQLDGVLYRDSSPASQSYMFAITGGSDFELFSSNATGAIQGSGYLYHRDDTYTGPRILHISGVSDWSVHDLVLVDSPMFHFVIDGAYNGEVYNMAIRGGDHGGLDGIDVYGDNIWIHDVMVTNKDECVTTKTNSHNFLIENIYCNSSGGCAIGSLGSGVNVTNILYRNVYTWDSNQMMMIKSNGHGNAYSLDLDSYWSSMDAVDGDGIYYHNITFQNWTGTAVDGETRPPIRVVCPEDTPCTEITLVQIDLWVEEGAYDEYYCANAYGSGYCLDSATGTTTPYTTTTYLNTAPTGLASRERRSVQLLRLWSSLRGSGRVIPAAISFEVRFILADIVSLFEIRWSANLVPALFEGLVSNPLPCLLESPACFLCALVPALFESSGWLYSLSTGSLSITNYTSQPHMAPNHWLLQTESTASFCLRLSASVNPSVLRRRRRPRVHHLMASKNGRYEKQRECFSFFHGPPLVKPNLSSPLTTSIEYHASLTRTKPGIEIAMRKVQDDRLNWEHDMIAKLGDFLIEEVDQQLQDTRSKGS